MVYSEIYSEQRTCLICGHRAAETRSTPLQCLHCGGLGFFTFFLAPLAIPRHPAPARSGPPRPAPATPPESAR